MKGKWKHVEGNYLKVVPMIPYDWFIFFEISPDKHLRCCEGCSLETDKMYLLLVVKYGDEILNVEICDDCMKALQQVIESRRKEVGEE